MIHCSKEILCIYMQHLNVFFCLLLVLILVFMFFLLDMTGHLCIRILSGCGDTYTTCTRSCQPKLWHKGWERVFNKVSLTAKKLWHLIATKRMSVFYKRVIDLSTRLLHASLAGTTPLYIMTVLNGLSVLRWKDR